MIAKKTARYNEVAATTTMALKDVVSTGASEMGIDDIVVAVSGVFVVVDDNVDEITEGPVFVK